MVVLGIHPKQHLGDGINVWHQRCRPRQHFLQEFVQITSAIGKPKFGKNKARDSLPARSAWIAGGRFVCCICDSGLKIGEDR